MTDYHYDYTFTHTTNEWRQDELMTCEVCGKETDMWMDFLDIDTREYYCICYECGEERNEESTAN